MARCSALGALVLLALAVHALAAADLTAPETCDPTPSGEGAGGAEDSRAGEIGAGVYDEARGNTPEPTDPEEGDDCGNGEGGAVLDDDYSFILEEEQREHGDIAVLKQCHLSYDFMPCFGEDGVVTRKAIRVCRGLCPIQLSAPTNKQCRPTGWLTDPFCLDEQLVPRQHATGCDCLMQHDETPAPTAAPTCMAPTASPTPAPTPAEPCERVLREVPCYAFDDDGQPIGIINTIPLPVCDGHCPDTTTDPTTGIPPERCLPTVQFTVASCLRKDGTPWIGARACDCASTRAPTAAPTRSVVTAAPTPSPTKDECRAVPVEVPLKCLVPGTNQFEDKKVTVRRCRGGCPDDTLKCRPHLRVPITDCFDPTTGAPAYHEGECDCEQMVTPAPTPFDGDKCDVVEKEVVCHTREGKPIQTSIFSIGVCAGTCDSTVERCLPVLSASVPNCYSSTPGVLYTTALSCDCRDPEATPRPTAEPTVAPTTHDTASPTASPTTVLKTRSPTSSPTTPTTDVCEPVATVVLCYDPDTGGIINEISTKRCAGPCDDTAAGTPQRCVPIEEQANPNCLDQQGNPQTTHLLCDCKEVVETPTSAPTTAAGDCKPQPATVPCFVQGQVSGEMVIDVCRGECASSDERCVATSSTPVTSCLTVVNTPYMQADACDCLPIKPPSPTAAPTARVTAKPTPSPSPAPTARDTRSPTTSPTPSPTIKTGGGDCALTTQPVSCFSASGQFLDIIQQRICSGGCPSDTQRCTASAQEMDQSCFDQSGNPIVHASDCFCDDSSTPDSCTPGDIVIIDTEDGAAGGAIVTGSWATVAGVDPNIHGSNFIHDDKTGKGEKSVEFDFGVPGLKPGVYAVGMAFTTSSSRPTNLPVIITHAGGTTTISLNQQTVHTGTFLSVGSFSFGTSGKVTIQTRGTDGFKVIADAVQLMCLDDGLTRRRSVEEAEEEMDSALAADESSVLLRRRREDGAAGTARLYSGVYLEHPTVDQRYFRSLSWNGLRFVWTALSSAGWRLVDVETHRRGNYRYWDAVFHRVSRGGGYGLWVAGWTSFRNKWEQWSRAGLRLIDLEVFTDGNSRKYAGVFMAGNDGHALWVGASWASFRAKWLQWSAQGKRLIDFESYYDPRFDSYRKYAGVFRQGSGGHALWVGASWSSFVGKWRDYADVGLRLVDLESYVINRGYPSQRRVFSGVFREQAGSRYGLWSMVSFESFSAQTAAFKEDGIDLIDMETHASSCLSECANRVINGASAYRYRITGTGTVYSEPRIEIGGVDHIHHEAIRGVASDPNRPSFRLPFSDTSVRLGQGWLYNDYTRHDALDYSKGAATFPVLAMAGGTVLFAGWDLWSGNTIVLSHGNDNWRTIYMHLRNGATGDCNRAWSLTMPWRRSNFPDSDSTEDYEDYLNSSGCPEFGNRTPFSNYWGTNSHTMLVSGGMSVTRGQQIGWTGNTGPGGKRGDVSGGGGENTHLHVFVARKTADNQWWFVDAYGVYGARECGYPRKTGLISSPCKLFDSIFDNDIVLYP